MRRRSATSTGTKKLKKKRVSKTRYLNLPEDHIRRWRSGDHTADGPGFWCLILGQYTGLGKCAHGGCDPEGRKCSFFKGNDAKEAVVEYHERTGKPVTSKLYELVTKPDGSKKYKAIQYGEVSVKEAKDTVEGE